MSLSPPHRSRALLGYLQFLLSLAVAFAAAFPTAGWIAFSVVGSEGRTTQGHVAEVAT